MQQSLDSWTRIYFSKTRGDKEATISILLLPPGGALFTFLQCCGGSLHFSPEPRNIILVAAATAAITVFSAAVIVDAVAAFFLSDIVVVAATLFHAFTLSYHSHKKYLAVNVMARIADVVCTSAFVLVFAVAAAAADIPVLVSHLV